MMQPTRYAPFIKRFAAYLVDRLVCGAMTAAMVVPLVLLFIPKFVFDTAFTSIFRGRGLRLEDIFESGPGMNFPLILNIVLFVLAICLIHTLYFALFESSRRQATPGKMLLGIFVTDAQGRRISFGRALGRNLSRVLSQMFCWLGYLLALFTQRNQALHDMIASTLVLEPAAVGPVVQPPTVEPPASPVTRSTTAPRVDTPPEAGAF
jgi:uncharacterized RDD family membrane protein YckC